MQNNMGVVLSPAVLSPALLPPAETTEVVYPGMGPPDSQNDFATPQDSYKPNSVNQPDIINI
jgi:hypothetical protein